MWSKVRTYLDPPKSDDYLLAQRYRLLHTMLAWAFVVGCLTAVLNLVTGDVRAAFILSAFALACLAGIVLNHFGRSVTAATLLCVGIFLAISLEAFYGAGLHDAAVVVFPILILCATFLFGNRWGLWAATVASIAVVFGLWWAESVHIVQTVYPATSARAISLAAIFLASAAVTRTVRSTWDDNMNGLVESYDNTLKGWALALEYRDGETAGHCQRVVGLSVRLAEALGCSDIEIETVKRGAYLHDIGKMGIPDEILKKPGPLTAEERQTIQEHPNIGLSLIGEIPFLEGAARIMYAHHECWDGSGYPRRLKAEEIPIGARIFCVVDHWDALCSDRPYRSGWSIDKVKAYIAEESGRIFDPKVAEAFLSVVDAEV